MPSPPDPAFVVRERTEPRHQVLCLRERVRAAGLPGWLARAERVLRGRAADAGAVVADAPFVRYHGPVTDAADGPAELCLPVDRPVPAAGAVRFGVLPPAAVAVVALAPDDFRYPRVLDAYDALRRWIAARGGAPDGPPRERAPGPGPGGPPATVSWPFRPGSD